MTSGAVILWLDGVAFERAREWGVSRYGASGVVHAASSLGWFMSSTDDNIVVMMTQELTMWPR